MKKYFKRQNSFTFLTFIGLILIIYSWFKNYPLKISSAIDYIFYNISSFYWIGLIILFFTFYIAQNNYRKKYLHVLYCVFFLIVLFSLNFFYYALPGSDSHKYRAINEYIISTGIIKPSIGHFDPLYHVHLNWPLFFILSFIINKILLLNVKYIEFMIFLLFLILYAFVYYLYDYNKKRDNIYMFIASYFMMLNWMEEHILFSPFTFSFILLIILFALENNKIKNIGSKYIVKLIIFITLTLSHPFVSIFYILFILNIYLLSKNIEYIKHLLLIIFIYVSIMIFTLESFMKYAIKELSKPYIIEYFNIFSSVFSGSYAKKPLLAEIITNISHINTVLIISILGISYVYLWINKKINIIDNAVFYTGLFYIILGAVFNIVGRRGILLIGIPICINSIYYLKNNYSYYFKNIFAIIMILFVLNIASKSFYDSNIQFQTKEEWFSENYLISKYNWDKITSIFAHESVISYLWERISSNTYFYADSSNIDLSNFEIKMNNYDLIFYSVGLEKKLSNNIKFPKELLIRENSNMIYNSGFSIIIKNIHK